MHSWFSLGGGEGTERGAGEKEEQEQGQKQEQEQEQERGQNLEQSLRDTDRQPQTPQVFMKGFF